MRRLLLFVALWFWLGQAASLAAAYDDFANGMSALNRGDNDLAVAAFTAALTAGDLSPSLVPVAYYERSMAHLHEQQCPSAVDDFTTAIKLKPDFVDAYIFRAAAQFCVGNHGAAIADYTQALSMRPTSHLLHARGLVRWADSDFSGAAIDFEEALKVAPNDVYVLLALEISRLRAGSFDANEMKYSLSKLHWRGWPKPLFDLLGGSSKPEEILRAADDDDSVVQANQRCEANFYIAEWWIAQKRVDLARTGFEYASKSCPRNFVEYEMAVVELRRME